jgi:hypothetical protein
MLALSLYIFTKTLVIDDVTNDIQGNINWCMFFDDDMVSIDKSRIKVDHKLEL